MPHKWPWDKGFSGYAAMRLALFEPDIPPNAGTLCRLGACMDVPVEIIEPCGFPSSDRAFRRAALDYLSAASLTHYRSWTHYLETRPPGRIVLLTTRAELPYTGFRFAPDDTLLVGRETAGVPDTVHARADARVRIPIKAPLRSLNVAIAAAMVLGEALRQTGRFPVLAAAEKEWAT